MNVSYAARVEQVVDFLVVVLKTFAPKKTGNLALNSIRKAWDGKSIYPIIVIGGEPAPYAIYTNEPWVADKWKGTPNPNQGWVQKAIESVRPIIIQMLSGTISVSDLKDIVDENRYKQVNNARKFITEDTFSDIVFSEFAFVEQTSYEAILNQQLSYLSK